MIVNPKLIRVFSFSKCIFNQAAKSAENKSFVSVGIVSISNRIAAPEPVIVQRSPKWSRARCSEVNEIHMLVLRQSRIFAAEYDHYLVDRIKAGGRRTRAGNFISSRLASISPRFASRCGVKFPNLGKII